MNQPPRSQGLLAGFYCLLCCITCLSACSTEKQEDPLLVPKDALAVVHIDFKQISGKANDWQNILDYIGAWSTGNANESLQKILYSGIDFKTTATFYTTSKSALLGIQLKSESSFVKMLKDQLKITPQKAEGYNYALSDNTLVAWRKGTAYLLMKQDGEKLEAKALLAELISQLDVQPEAQLQHPAYQALLAKNYDISYWVLAAGLADNVGMKSAGRGVINTEGLKSASENLAHLTGGVSFEKGETLVQLEVQFSELFVQKYGKIAAKPLAQSTVLKQMPYDSPALLLGLQTDIPTLTKVLQEDKASWTNFEMFAKFIGLSATDILQTLDGSLLLSAQQLSPSSLFMGADAAISLGTSSEAQAQKALNGFSKAGVLQKRGELFTLPISFGVMLNARQTPTSINMALSEKTLMAKGAPLPQSFQAAVGNSTVALYINIPQLLPELDDALNLNKETKGASKRMAEEMTFLTFGASGIDAQGKANATIHLGLKDNSTNAVSVLLRIFQPQKAS
ncbi:DUF4836 family protein [Eisenibacter elegans]|uniref:DUF4836 family protein n=1 Tax=Eisenibacter elegans TaxID=997 RepID=UPI0003FD45CC|nr:DUF4836 family protein [Eisenibacter elegans]